MRGTGTDAVQPAAGAMTFVAGHENGPSERLTQTAPGAHMAISTLPKRTTQEDAVSSDQTRILDHLRTHVRIVTPAQAREILEHQNWSRQRDLRRSHVTYLVSCIERGELTELSLIFAEMPSGQKLLVDGQHRLTALVQTDKTLPATVTIHRVNDEHDLARVRYRRSGERQPDHPQADRSRGPNPGGWVRSDVPPEQKPDRAVRSR